MAEIAIQHQPQYGYPNNSGHTVVIEQPRLVGQRQNITVWTSGLCACFDDMGSFLFSMLCPCIHACMVAGKMKESCLVPTCTGEAGVVAMRTKVRTAYGITGTLLGDCCIVTCCQPCAMCQMDRELDRRGVHIF